METSASEAPEADRVLQDFCKATHLLSARPLELAFSEGSTPKVLRWVERLPVYNRKDTGLQTVQCDVARVQKDGEFSVFSPD